MKRRTKTSAVAVLTTMIIGIAVVSALVFPASAADVTSSGHWVDNLGAGATATAFTRSNEHPDCDRPEFTAGTSDLWVFEIRGATNSRSIPVWDGSVPAWSTDVPVVVRDVTPEYGVYLPDPSTKRLYIETSPPGARLNVAHILYAGSSTSEVLLRTCAHQLDVHLRGPMVASYDLSYRWTIDAKADWRVVDSYTFDVSYEASRHRHEVPIVQPGSAHVRGSLEIDGSTLPTQIAEATYLDGKSQQPCSIEPVTFVFDCAIDESLLPTDPLTGRPNGIGSVTITLITPNGTRNRSFLVNWANTPPSNIFGTSATIRNHRAMASHKEVQVSEYATKNLYEETWRPGSNYCTTTSQVFELIGEPAASPTPIDRTTTTLTWCRPRPGYSLQYLGGPYGIPMVIANSRALQSQYPSALSGLPPLTNRDEIREFLGSVSCLQSCRALFRAQFLTAAFNALDPAFAQQTIQIRNTCLTVAQYLTMVDTEAPRLDETALVIRKAELERINGSLVTTCPTVATAGEIPGTVIPT